MSRLRLLPLLFLLPSLAAAEDWPGWRGPTGQGHSAADPPLTWGPTENVQWKAPLPDRGNASPAIWGNHIFLTQANRTGSKRGVLCIDRKTGKEKWATYIDFQGNEPTHGTNPYGSATCATDGERVIASLGSAGLLCLDFNGKELWRKDLGQFIHIWGNASSPVLHGDNVILWCGPGARQFLVALNKKTGDEVWRHEEPGGHSGLGEKKAPWIGSWSTPVITKVGDREELILSVPKTVKGFDPKTGKELWSCAGLTDLVYTSPVVSPDGTVAAMSGYGGSALAVKAGGTGDVTRHRLWHHPRSPQRIGSAVIVGDHAYLVNEPGRGSCFELKSGKDVWNRESLLGKTWGSFVHAAGRLYVTATNGETLVVKADPKLQELARNRLPDEVLASIAIADNELFIRGYKFLWCIAAKK